MVGRYPAHAGECRARDGNRATLHVHRVWYGLPNDVVVGRDHPSHVRPHVGIRSQLCQEPLEEIVHVVPRLEQVQHLPVVPPTRVVPHLDPPPEMLIFHPLIHAWRGHLAPQAIPLAQVRKADLEPGIVEVLDVEAVRHVHVGDVPDLIVVRHDHGRAASRGFRRPLIQAPQVLTPELVELRPFRGTDRKPPVVLAACGMLPRPPALNHALVA